MDNYGEKCILVGETYYEKKVGFDSYSIRYVRIVADFLR